MYSVERAIQQIKRGKVVIVIDDIKRENEGDFIVAAQKITAEAVNFLITHGRGLVCLAIQSRLAKKLRLPLMVNSNSSKFKTNFTVSVDGAKKVGSGISAQDRANTVKIAINNKTKPGDLRRPGHIFPLVANSNGVLGRSGHTEAAVDLARLAGLTPAGVLCEILGPSGRAATRTELYRLAKKFHLAIITIEKLKEYLRVNQ